MNTKTKTTIEDLLSSWLAADGGTVCSNPECPNARRIHIVAETITIHTLVVAGGELPPEIRERLARAHA